MGSVLPTSTPCDVKDLALADVGKRRIEWAFQSMPVLQNIRKQFIKTQPLTGVRVSACLHVTTETANLLIAMRDGGASPSLCASNPLSTQDDVAAALVKDYGIPVYAIRGESNEVYQAHIAAAADHGPQITMENGGDLVHMLHTKRPERAAGVLGGTEETATGVRRLRAMARDGVLKHPVIAVTEAITKHLADNRYGTGQSTIDGIVRATNIMLSGSNFVIAGYGWCGRGVALRARGMGANVIITEIDPIKAIEAAMEGFRVTSMMEAAAMGDVFVTVTGNKCVITRQHFEKMKNNAVVCNAGHSNVEIDLDALSKMTSSKRTVRESVEEYALRDGRRLIVLAQGRLVNLAAGEGHPSAVMDLCFANEALAVEYLVKNHTSLEKRVYPMPEDLDRRVAQTKLESMGVKIDRLTPEQEAYLAGWSEGT